MRRRLPILLLLAAPATASAEQPLPAPPPIVRPQILLCSAADIKAAMRDAAASASGDASAAALAAFRARVSSCVATKLEWAKTSTSGPTTWYRARTTLGDYFFDLWKGGAFVGSKPEEAYFVRCDATTMTQTDRNLGRLICVYGAAPIKPAELESFTVSILTTGPGP